MMLDHANPKTSSDFHTAVLKGLSQDTKSISPKWLYDAQGSALFEEITRLPEYKLTRTETEILHSNSGLLASLVPRGGALVEFGSGASVKTRLLLDHGEHFGAYVPIDISEAFLIHTAITLRADYPRLRVLPVVGDFLSPVRFPEMLKNRPKTGFFPGSTIGNITSEDASKLLERARRWSGTGRFILGLDLVKDEAELISAYNDVQGITAAFISNILHRMKRELDADIDAETFCYCAEWNDVAEQIEMSLVSSKRQTITVGGRAFLFEEGERLHVSTSRKFTRNRIETLAQAAGWALEDLLTDDRQTVAIAVLR